MAENITRMMAKSGETRRPRTDKAKTQAVILDAAERLLVAEGYAAVSNRKIAQSCGLKPALILYHFKTMDDLFTALYRRAAERSLERHTAALAQQCPVSAIWDVNAEGEQTALALEFLAMANHRKFIRDEMAFYAEKIRALQVASLERYLQEQGLKPRPPFTPMALAVVLAAVARSLVMEAGVGIQLGHVEVKATFKTLLDSYFIPAADVPETTGP
jgi:AcrR family transcriptional regulator